MLRLAIATALALALGLAPACVGSELTPIEPSGPDAGEPGDPPPANPDAAPVNVDLLAEWSGCMTQVNWDAAQMGSWSQKLSEGGTVCSSCHGDGLGQFNTDTDNVAMYASNRYAVFITGFFSLGVLPGGEVDVVPAYDKLSRKGGGDNNHPTFAVGQGDEHYEHLDTFYQLTMQARQAGLCGPPEFPTPP